MVVLEPKNIVGLADKTSWVQAQTVNLEDGKKVMFLINLSCSGEDSLLDLGLVGSELIAEIEKELQVMVSMQDLPKIVAKILSQVDKSISIDLQLGASDGDSLTLCGHGLMHAYLIRNGKIAVLKNNWQDSESINGQLLEGDQVILCSEKFVQLIPVQNIFNLINDPDLAESLAPMIHAQASNCGAGAIVAKVKSDELSDEVAKESWIHKWRFASPSLSLNIDKPRRNNLWIGGVLLVLLFLMIAIGMVRKTKMESDKQYLQVEEFVQSKLAETMATSELNPEKARGLMLEAKGNIDNYLKTEPKQEYVTKANQLKAEIDKTESTAFKKNEVKLETVVELSILSEGFVSQNMKTDGKGNLVFADKAGDKLVSMNLQDRSRQIIESKEVNKYSDFAVSDSKVYGLDSSGATALSWKKNEVSKVIEADEFWKSPTIMELFAGNIYIFDNEQSEIWKYPVINEGFGARRRWLAAGITPDLSKVIDMKVIGDLWLLTSSGKIERYSRGAPVDFSLEGFPSKLDTKRLSEPSAVWVNDSLVYIVENGAMRVVVFNTEGKFVAQYANEEFKNASDIVVVDDKAYVLIDNVVKEFGL